MQDSTWSKMKQLTVSVALAFGLSLAACSENVEDAAEVPASGAARIDADDTLPSVPIMGPERNIVAFGDSLFAGYGVDPDDSYPAKLEAALRAQGVNADIVNAGVSGDTSAAGLQRLAFTLDAQEEKPDLLILELGGNDLLRGLSPDETRANFEKMLDELASRDIPVLLMGMRAPANYGEEYQAQFDAMYGDLAREYDAALIPFWLEDIYQDQSLFQDDRIHPTVDGIEALVTSTLDDVRAALPEEGAGQG